MFTIASLQHTIQCCKNCDYHTKSHTLLNSMSTKSSPTVLITIYPTLNNQDRKIEVEALFDTGAERNFVSSDIFDILVEAGAEVVNSNTVICSAFKNSVCHNSNKVVKFKFDLLTEKQILLLV